jgi:predicted  nucleic acid-binding Zn-ribbon protein
VLIESLVDILIDHFVDGTEAEFSLLTIEEQVEKLHERRDILNREIELSKKRHEREQHNLVAQLERLNMRLQTLPKQKRW